MTRKLYTDVSLETPFTAVYNDETVETFANDDDTLTIGSTTYIRITDENSHNVKAVIPNSGDDTPRQLLLLEGEGSSQVLCYIEGDGTVSTTNIIVTDVIIPDQYTFTINPTPADATVTLTAAGFTQLNNSITVDDGTTVSWSVSKSNYVTQNGSYTVNGNDYTMAVTLTPATNVTFTLDVSPYEAIDYVTFTCDDPNATIVDNEITCIGGSTLSYEVDFPSYKKYTSPQFIVNNTHTSPTLCLLLEGFLAGWHLIGDNNITAFTATDVPQAGDTIYLDDATDTGNVVDNVVYNDGVATIIINGDSYMRDDGLDRNAPSPFFTLDWDSWEQLYRGQSPEVVLNTRIGSMQEGQKYAFTMSVNGENVEWDRVIGGVPAGASIECRLAKDSGTVPLDYFGDTLTLYCELVYTDSNNNEYVINTNNSYSSDPEVEIVNKVFLAEYNDDVQFMFAGFNLTTLSYSAVSD